MRAFWRAALEVIRLTCAHERLGEPPGASAPAAASQARRSLRLLFATEPLPLDPAAPSGPPRRRWLHWLFAPEPLPRDPEPPPRRGRGRIAALFASERLDDAP